MIAWRKTPMFNPGAVKAPKLSKSEKQAQKAAKADDAPSPESAKTILVVKFDGLTQFLHALAAAKIIRERHVGARITLLTCEPMRALAEKCPYFDVIEIDTSWRPAAAKSDTSAGGPAAAAAATMIAAAPDMVSAGSEAPTFVQLVGKLRAQKFDMVYDLENSARTRAIFQGLRPWPPLWNGSAAGASHAYADPERRFMHPLDGYRAQLGAAGVKLQGALLPDLTWVRTALRDPPRLQPEYFGIRGPFVVLLPRGTEVEPHRRWPQEKYVELARRLAAQGVTPVILGGPEERAIGAAVAQAEKRARNLVTRTDVFQTISLCERAAYAAGDDVELMHVAAGSGASCIAFLSSNCDPSREAPRGSGGVVLLTAAVLADLPVEQVDRQLRNIGVYARAATA